MPVMDTTVQSVVESAQAAVAAGADVIEWRIDYLVALHPKDSFSLVGAEILAELLTAVDVPLLLTIRTSEQGGQLRVKTARYGLLVAEIFDTLRQNQADPERIGIDFEFWFPEVEYLVARANEAGYTAVVSHHDWEETPDSEILQLLFAEILELPGAVAKVAVTAQHEDDVDRLFAVTEQVVAETGRSVIALAMGEIGVRSRLVGHLHGSVATFAAGKTASAPGQLSVAEMREEL
ncbi:MAG: type I 3-dehydroquinate dehydratase [Trueperella sp.]|nr:type I 3-dehydroquinate dehydratase [Trueperella sp.]